MRFALLDLMPILWGMCAAVAILLALRGEWGAPTRTLPAVAAGTVLYFADFPPRVQVVGFVLIYGVAALCLWLLRRIGDWRRQRIKRLQTEKN